MNKDEISKQLRELFKDKKCNFYKGSKLIQVENIIIHSDIDYKEGKFHNHYNYEVKGKAEFNILDSNTGDSISNGIEYFSTLIQVENNQIISIDRINIKPFPF